MVGNLVFGSFLSIAEQSASRYQFPVRRPGESRRSAFVRPSAIEFVAFKREGDIPRRPRKSLFRTSEIDGLNQAASGTKVEAQMPFLENSWRRAGVTVLAAKTGWELPIP